jgi:large subunit ribosomal protein L31
VKPEIHPKYYDAKVRCACGHEFVVGSTQKEIRLDICSKCHPFFTGKQKYVDTAGRVDKYFRKYGEDAQRKFKKKKKKLVMTEEEIARELETAGAEEAQDIEEAVEPEPAAEPAPAEMVAVAVETVAEAAPPAAAEAPAPEPEAAAPEPEAQDQQPTQEA